MRFNKPRLSYNNLLSEFYQGRDENYQQRISDLTHFRVAGWKVLLHFTFHFIKHTTNNENDEIILYKKLFQ